MRRKGVSKKSDVTPTACRKQLDPITDAPKLLRWARYTGRRYHLLELLDKHNLAMEWFKLEGEIYQKLDRLGWKPTRTNACE